MTTDLARPGLVGINVGRRQEEVVVLCAALKWLI